MDEKIKGGGGSAAHFMVAISYQNGVFMCEQYEKMNGPHFSDFVKRNFRQMFRNSVNPNCRFAQDVDPSQNSRAAARSMEKTGVQQISIPPRSPDLNPTVNFFHLIEQKRKRDAIDRNITRESCVEFSRRVCTITVEYPSERIDKIIDTMNKRINTLSKNKEKRLKY